MYSSDLLAGDSGWRQRPANIVPEQGGGRRDAAAFIQRFFQALPDDAHERRSVRPSTPWPWPGEARTATGDLEDQGRSPENEADRVRPRASVAQEYRQASAHAEHGKINDLLGLGSARLQVSHYPGAAYLKRAWSNGAD